MKNSRGKWPEKAPSSKHFQARLKNCSLNPKIKKFLSSKNITHLYEFQERAIDAILKGKNVVIAAPTTSGKTEAFALPILQKILEENESEAKGLKLNFVLSDSRRLPFKDASFELVATQNAPPYVGEMRRISKNKILACYSFGGVLFNFAVNKIVGYLKKHGLETNSAKTGYGIYFIGAKEPK